MATIIDLRDRAARPQTTGTAIMGGAEVVIFPGVRYERMSDDQPAPEALKARRSRKRDCLELDD